jgi:hypothetical protein
MVPDVASISVRVNIESDNPRPIHPSSLPEIDLVVCYKVDRLSRSLLDFAKMMETFERHGVSFVSITQQFNSATSKGDVARSNWLLNEDIAFIYRAYATHDWLLKITSPSSMSAKNEVFDAGSAVT